GVIAQLVERLNGIQEVFIGSVRVLNVLCADFPYRVLLTLPAQQGCLVLVLHATGPLNCLPSALINESIF
ncbi:hypothetical protein EBX31_07315, partial [bacterium]|nr:hypothetical protein [bacterium]